MASFGETFIAGQHAISSTSTSLPFQTASTSSQNVMLTTVQGEGMHLVDLEDVSPLAAITLGPSATFMTPAVSCVSKKGKERLIAVAPADKSEIWYWNAQMKADGTFVEQPTKQIKKVCKQAWHL